MIHQRGGQTLKTGKIGRVNCLRQQILLPGETLDISLKGSVKLEALRERDSLRMKAHLAVFMTPLRWLWDGWPQYLKDGPEGLTSPPTISTQQLYKYGIGASSPTSIAIPQFWRDAYLRVYNEWYKWPEDPDFTGGINGDGEIAVPLEAPFSRARQQAGPSDSGNFDVASATEFDVRELAATQAAFVSAMRRDVLSYNRYMELVREMYGADGSREVDRVPMKIDEVSVGVDPRELPATDGASLGQWQSILDFDIDHQIDKVVCPEHCILTYMLTVRFAPVIEGRSPFSFLQSSWAEQVGDSEMLGSMMPVDLTTGQISPEGNATVLGKLPAGWQWRAGHDVIGERIDVRNSFPYMLVPFTAPQAKDSTRIKAAFRSQSLGDYVVDCYIGETSRSPIDGALESYFSGMRGRGDKREFPAGGKML